MEIVNELKKKFQNILHSEPQSFIQQCEALYEAWETIKEDIGRWTFVIGYTRERKDEHPRLVVMLDNDQTYIQIVKPEQMGQLSMDDETRLEELNSESSEFKWYIGDAQGVQYLLQAAGVDYEQV